MKSSEIWIIYFSATGLVEFIWCQYDRSYGDVKAKACALSLTNALILVKSLSSRIWENSPFIAIQVTLSLYYYLHRYTSLLISILIYWVTD